MRPELRRAPRAVERLEDLRVGEAERVRRPIARLDERDGAEARRHRERAEVGRAHPRHVGIHDEAEAVDAGEAGHDGRALALRRDRRRAPRRAPRRRDVLRGRRSRPARRRPRRRPRRRRRASRARRRFAARREAGSCHRRGTAPRSPRSERTSASPTRGAPGRFSRVRACRAHHVSRPRRPIRRPSTRPGAASSPGTSESSSPTLDDTVLQAELALRPEHFAPNGFVHAGVLVTLADTAAGYGCVANLPPDSRGLHDARAEGELPRRRPWRDAAVRGQGGASRQDDPGLGCDDHRRCRPHARPLPLHAARPPAATSRPRERPVTGVASRAASRTRASCPRDPRP